MTYLTENSAVAVPLFRRALEIRRRALGDGDPNTTDALYALAQAVHTSGDFRSARSLFDRWVTAISRQPRQVTPARASQLIFLASILQFSGRLDEAERLAREALAIDRSLYGDLHHRVGSDLSKLGSILDDAGRRDQAGSTLRAAVDVLRPSYPDGHVELAEALRNLGFHLEETDRWVEAEGVAHGFTSATCSGRQGKFAEAESIRLQGAGSALADCAGQQTIRE